MTGGEGLGKSELEDPDKKKKQKKNPGDNNAHPQNATLADSNSERQFGINFANDLFTEFTLNKALNKGRLYKDGGYSNHIDIHYSEKLKNNSSVSVSLSNDMLTQYKNSYDGDRYGYDRPNLGYSQLTVGYAHTDLNVMGNSKFSNTHIMQGSVGYKDLNFTSQVQAFVHKIFDVDKPKYYNYPGEEGFTYTLSAGDSFKFTTPLSDKAQLFSAANIGATIGSYTGANSGLSIGAGNMRPQDNMAFRTESQPLEYITSDGNKKGWNVHVDYNFNYTLKNPVFNKKAAPTHHSGVFHDSDGTPIDEFVLNLDAVTNLKKMNHSLSLNAELAFGRMLLKGGVVAYTNPAENTKLNGQQIDRDLRNNSVTITDIINEDRSVPAFCSYGYVGMNINLGKGRKK